jgi:hypothetical protein
MSKFLVVINGSTPNTAIIQTLNVINDGLHFPSDVFNLSLTGSFKMSGAARNILWDYLGKTVIIFANPLNYFQAGSRDAWDLLDPWEAYLLAKRGLRFLFISPTNPDSLKSWAAQAASPAFDT